MHPVLIILAALAVPLAFYAWIKIDQARKRRKRG